MGVNCCKGEMENEKELYTIADEETNGESSLKKRKSKRKNFYFLKKPPNELNSVLKKLLTKKFYSINSNIKFNEIPMSKFEEILNKNIYYKRIINNLKEEINDIFFEEETKYDNIVPIEINLSGEKQYYQGSYNSEGKCHGPGIWSQKHNIYFGNFYNDEFSGKGLFIDPKGNYYFGDWKHNKCNGQGNLIIDGIEAYQGDFQDNKKWGEGIENLKNSDVYFGHFYKEDKNGNGKYIFSEGTAYEGTFNKSKITGKGKIKFNDGKKFIGEFDNGEINGIGELFYDNGIKFKGIYLMNKKNGKGEYIWPDGKKFEGNWKNNNLEQGIFEDKDNKIKEPIKCKNGKLLLKK